MISIRQAFAGKHVLLTGGSGFLGKVWLSAILERVPEIGKIYVLLRKNGHPSVQNRLESMLNDSYVFKPLHDRLGVKLSEYISERLVAVQGDVTLPNLGLDERISAILRDQLDLAINCVGLVDFNPDIRDAIATNIQGVLNLADFIESCKKASLLHVSTCYVAGTRQGTIAEKIEGDVAPNNLPFDPEAEHADILNSIQALEKKLDSDPEFEASVRNRLKEKGNEKDKHPKNLISVLRRKHVRKLMIDEGLNRAMKYGWPNTYTYTKAMADAFLKKRASRLKFAVFRPSIVESSVSYPFPGWNEGFNTSGPLAYLLGTWFRYLPAKIGNPFDIIPVDLVTNGITIAAAELMLGVHSEVYHCGSSDRNRFTIDRACELTSLSHRVHYRKNGQSVAERVFLSRWDTVPVPAGHFLSISKIKSTTDRISNWVSRTPGMKKWSERLQKATKKLKQVEDMLNLFLPFIHDNYQIFEAKALSAHVLVESEFEFTPEKINWREYWLNIHMPGLRRWCFPQIEGGKKEIYEPVTPVRLSAEQKRPPVFESPYPKKRRPEAVL